VLSKKHLEAGVLLAKERSKESYPIASVEQKTLGGWSTLGQGEIERVRRRRDRESDEAERSRE
jgi:hypothetical protein